MAPDSGVLVLEHYLLNLLKMNLHFLDRRAMMFLNVEVVGRDAGYAVANMLAAGGFENQHHVAVVITANCGEKSGKLGLEKTPIKGELSTLEGGWLGYLSLFLLVMGDMKP